MSKANPLSEIAPPPRQRTAMPAIETPNPNELVPVNCRIDADLATQLKMLSAKTRTPMRELMERALRLLMKEVGEV